MRAPDGENWLIVNHGSPDPRIVVGSGLKQVEKHVNVANAQQDRVKIIKRFTGGGTVFVDHHSLFVSFIGNTQWLNFPMTTQQQVEDGEKNVHRRAFPQDIMQWTELFYQQVFEQHFPHMTGQFALRENDYVLGQRKFGGNAQYITGGKVPRWVHHTSFLWDYHDESMHRYLHLPERRPNYRESRDHSTFLCKLKHHLTLQNSGTTVAVEQEELEGTIFMDAVIKTFLSFCEGPWSSHVAQVEQNAVWEQAIERASKLKEDLCGTIFISQEQKMSF